MYREFRMIIAAAFIILVGAYGAMMLGTLSNIHKQLELQTELRNEKLDVEWCMYTYVISGQINCTR